MKNIFVTLVFLSFLNAGEMPNLEAGEVKRIGAIIKDIGKLRIDNNKCQSQLNEEKQKNAVLRAEKDFENDLATSNKSLSKKVAELEKIIITLRKKNSGVTKENNTFPKLMMKEKYKEEVTAFKAAAFVLSTDSIIYSSIKGKKIDKWEKGTSFTSNKKSKNWIKITGYFVNKKWKISEVDMWVKIAQVSKK
ncbi:hypothetical protein HUE87_05990 [Candidatus Sulfurimonas marisnigri]|uniref:Uncharacterized protein n=1 Tax=Candidatus Sulfurimonas marisnigri TaxID=2740405 RepID=A0A7S7M376_9BACT|nr:hypothetical protein [Candidatus Sulfurimonas marisnigri]QOY55774.1 hypothetical protein HUE87_05990 [Candidatus Sulfurimonas marisnigri]